MALYAHRGGLYENKFYANNIVALRYGFFMAFDDSCLWIFIIRCAPPRA
jgi:hypothetical protein